MAIAVKTFSREALEEWIQAVYSFPDIESGERRLGRIFVQGWRGEVRGSPEPIWEFKPLRSEDDWPSPAGLVEAAWGALEDAELWRWRKVRARATIVGGGECPNRTWTGEGIEGEEIAAFDTPREPLQPTTSVGRIPRQGEMAEVLGAVGEVISSLREVTAVVSQFAVVQNKALEGREKLLLKSLDLIGGLTQHAAEIRGEALEAQAELLVSTREAASLQQQLNVESELSTTLSKAAGAGATALVGAISDTDMMRKRIIKGLSQASDEELIKLASMPEAQGLLAKLSAKMGQSTP